MTAEEFIPDNNISIVRITDTRKIYEILLKFYPLFLMQFGMSLAKYAKKLSEKAFVFAALYNDDIV